MSFQQAQDIIQHLYAGQKVKRVAKVQSLWSNYGEIARYRIGNKFSIILKWVDISKDNIGQKHPRGWSGQHSHDRKISSYINEQRFYRNYSSEIDENCYLPSYLGSDCLPSEDLPDCMWLALEDLDAIGFAGRTSTANLHQAQKCVEWLANFHAHYLTVGADDLWPTGTYWHLGTRFDELNAMPDGLLKEHAHAIDLKLISAKYQTLVHGDAKLANFCFDDVNNRVAAVDFQYVGKGIGVKDLCYFIGSCFFEEDIERNEKVLRNHYFYCFERAALKKFSRLEIKRIINEWQYLYPFCWADFERFLRGWAPGHKKLCHFSKQMTDFALSMVVKD